MNATPPVHEAPGRDLLASLPPGPIFGSVLLVDPRHFDVLYQINPHMKPGEEPVDAARARQGHEALRRAYESIGYAVRVLDADAGLPDLVFCANQSFPWTDAAGRPRALLSVMAHEARRAEVPLLERFYGGLGWEVDRLPEGPDPIEGQGDLLWFPGRRLVIGGHGFRTTRARLDQFAALTGIATVPIRLVDERFYHLDTCLSPIDADRALWIEAAFDEPSRDRLRALFPRLIEVPEEEAASCLAANAHCPDGRNVLIEAAASRTIALLEAEGLRVLPIDTAPFLLSGGSVFCLKQMLPRELPSR